MLGLRARWIEGLAGRFLTLRAIANGPAGRAQTALVGVDHARNLHCLADRSARSVCCAALAARFETDERRRCAAQKPNFDLLVAQLSFGDDLLFLLCRALTTTPTNDKCC